MFRHALGRGVLLLTVVLFAFPAGIGTAGTIDGVVVDYGTGQLDSGVLVAVVTMHWTVFPAVSTNFGLRSTADLRLRSTTCG
jgi:hypothetical protein